MEFRRRGIVCSPAWIDDDRPLWTQTIEMQPYGLPDAPFDSVPHDGLADRAGDGETDPGAGEFGFTQTKCGEERARKPASSVVDPAKILGSEYADTFRKTRDATTFRR